MLTTVCLAATLLCLASALPQIENLDRPGRIPGEYLVVLKPTTQAQKASYVQDAVAKIQSLSASISLIDKFDALESPILHFQADEVAISQAFKIPDVVAIEANVLERRIEQCSSQNSFSSYWGLSRISSRPAPNYSNAQFRYVNSGGSGIRVYVLDTGIRTSHEDFSGGRAVFGTNTIGGGNTDVDGHGTHCAGTVAGGNSGVAKGATVVAVKVLDDNGDGTAASIVNGVNWSVSNLGSSRRGVLSMSLGGGGSSSIDSAVTSAIDANIPVVVAAGNENQNACNVSPARVGAAITVGSTDNQDALSWFSNWGNCVDILAPGSDIRSAGHNGDSSYVNNSGTSMACPAVAGAVAVYLAQNSNANPAQVKDALVNGSSSGYINLRGTSGTPDRLLYENC